KVVSLSVTRPSQEGSIYRAQSAVGKGTSYIRCSTDRARPRVSLIWLQSTVQADASHLSERTRQGTSDSARTCTVASLSRCGGVLKGVASASMPGRRGTL